MRINYTAIFFTNVILIMILLANIKNVKASDAVEGVKDENKEKPADKPGDKPDEGKGTVLTFFGFGSPNSDKGGSDDDRTFWTKVLIGVGIFVVVAVIIAVVLALFRKT
ncbi:hypothetical protein COBT_002874 [Conglomerata obtusa]